MKMYKKLNNIVARAFWRGVWAKLTLIAAAEVVVHGLFVFYKRTDLSAWYLTAWSVWLAVCVAVRVIVKMYKKTENEDI